MSTIMIPMLLLILLLSLLLFLQSRSHAYMPRPHGRVVDDLPRQCLNGMFGILQLFVCSNQSEIGIHLLVLNFRISFVHEMITPVLSICFFLSFFCGFKFSFVARERGLSLIESNLRLVNFLKSLFSFLFVVCRSVGGVMIPANKTQLGLMQVYATFHIFLLRFCQA